MKIALRISFTAIITVIFIVVFLTGYTPFYMVHLIQEKRLNGVVNGTFSCDNNYSWQVTTYAQAIPRNFLGGLHSDLSATKTLRLLHSGKAISMGGQKLWDRFGPAESSSSLAVLESFQGAYVFPNLVNQISLQRKEPHNLTTNQLWSIYWVHSEDVSDNDFNVVANCFISNMPEINRLYMIPVSENTDKYITTNLPFGALILQKGEYKKFSNGEYMDYVCDDQLEIHTYGNKIALSPRNIDGKSQQLLAVVGLDGILQPQIFIDGGRTSKDQSYLPTSKDEWALKEFDVLKDRIANKQCVNKHNQNIKDVIQSIPGKIKYLKQ